MSILTVHMYLGGKKGSKMRPDGKPGTLGKAILPPLLSKAGGTLLVCASKCMLLVLFPSSCTYVNVHIKHVRIIMTYMLYEYLYMYMRTYVISMADVRTYVLNFS